MEAEVVQVKTEALSPPRPSDNLNIVKKWRERVLLRKPISSSDNGENGNGGNGSSPARISWVKMIERRMAVLRVAYPFLTERQLQGKAWEECGFNSIMGGVPRSGLSPKIKKEFIKRIRNCSRIGQKPKFKKEPKTEPCPYTFLSPKPLQSQTSDKYMNTSCSTEVQTVSVDANTFDLFQLSYNQNQELAGDDSLSLPSFTKKIKRVHFEDQIDQVLTETNYILPNTPSIFSTTDAKCFNQVNKVVTGSTFLNEKIILQPNSSIYPSTREVSSEISSDFNNIPNENSFQNNLTEVQETLIINFKHLEQCLRLDQNKDIETECSQQLSNEIIKRNKKTIINLNLNEKFTKQDNIGIKFNNSYPGEITPVRNIITDAKKKITFETKAQVYHNNDDIVEETQILEETRKDLSQLRPSIVPGYNGFSVPSSVVNKIESALEYFKRKDKNENRKICLIPVHHVHPAHRYALKLCELHFESEQMHEKATPEMNSSKSVTFSETKPPNKSEINHKINYNQNCEPVYHDYKFNHNCKSPNYYSDNFIVSLPLTPTDLLEYIKLPPNSLLSNYCSEHDRAYTKVDLRPVFHRNYYSDKIIKPLKNDFNRVIPSDQPLKQFFDSKNIKFKQVKYEVSKKIEYILAMLNKECS